MSNGLEKVADILKRLNDELAIDLNNLEKKYGRSDVLPTSDSTTGDARICCGKCKGECE